MWNINVKKKNRSDEDNYIGVNYDQNIFSFWVELLTESCKLYFRMFAFDEFYIMGTGNAIVDYVHLSSF